MQKRIANIDLTMPKKIIRIKEMRINFNKKQFHDQIHKIGKNIKV